MSLEDFDPYKKEEEIEEEEERPITHEDIFAKMADSRFAQARERLEKIREEERRRKYLADFQNEIGFAGFDISQKLNVIKILSAALAEEYKNKIAELCEAGFKKLSANVNDLTHVEAKIAEVIGRYDKLTTLGPHLIEFLVFVSIETKWKLLIDYVMEMQRVIMFSRSGLNDKERINKIIEQRDKEINNIMINGNEPTLLDILTSETAANGLKIEDPTADRLNTTPATEEDMDKEDAEKFLEALISNLGETKK